MIPARRERMEDAFLAAFIQHSSFIIQHSFGNSDGAHNGGRGLYKELRSPVVCACRFDHR
jgi:hypothetical protein